MTFNCSGKNIGFYYPHGRKDDKREVKPESVTNVFLYYTMKTFWGSGKDV